MKQTRRRALNIVAALLGALFVLSCLVGFAACGGGSKDDCDTNGHTVTSWTTTKDATCTEAGSRTGVCDVCGETVTEPIEALGHNWVSGTVVEATCVKGGYTPQTCSRCGATQNINETQATGLHNYVASTDPDDGYVAATCGEPGTSVQKCTMCGDIVTDTIPATGEHTWGEGVVTTPATTEAEGVMTYTCTVCGATYTEPIAKLERLVVPDPENDELDAAAMKVPNSTESFEGYDYTVAKSTTTNEDEEEEAAYLITGTASAMTDSIVKWYNDGDTGAAKVGDSYITLKIYVGIGNTISYTSAGDEEKSYTNTTETDGNMFDGDYLFVVQRLTGVHDDGTQVTSLDGVSYTITDGSGNVREEVSIIFDMTTAAWDGTSHSEAWYTTDSSATEFTIYSAEEFAGLAHVVNGDDEVNASHIASKVVKLGANINLDNQNWTPIGHQTDTTVGYDGTTCFEGDFDGNGHTIYNLDIEPGTGEEHEQIGLFGHVFGGEFDNIHITNAKVVGTKNVGVIAGNTQAGNGSGGTYGQSCTFSNCTVDGLVDVEGTYQVGGLIGGATETTIQNCSVNGDEGSKVTAWDGDTTNSSEYSVGGIVGCAVGEKSEGSMESSVWSGLSVSGLEISSPARVGGIAGKYSDQQGGNITMENCTVSDCVLSIVTGSATTKTPTIGALIGVYTGGICILEGNKVDNVQINYTDENYIGSSSDGTYLLFGGSEPVSGSESSTYVSFTDSDDKTYTIATTNLTGMYVRVSVPVADVTFNEVTFNGTTAEITVTDDGFKIDNIVANKMSDDQKAAFDESYTSDETTRFYIAVQIAVQPGETVTVTGGGKTEEISNETDKVSYTLWVIEIGQSHFENVTAGEEEFVTIDLSSFSMTVTVTTSDNSTTTYTISFGNVLVAATDLTVAGE